jgi:ribosomal protein S18 acetylase RimI-like enzyme
VTTPRVILVPVREREYDDFFAMFETYHRELDAYDPDADEPWSLDEYRAAVLDDLEGREQLWIRAGGDRAGFVVVRTLPDWPREERDIAEIAEFYVAPDFRRRGVGQAAVAALLAEHRRRGTHLVEASILRNNAAAHAFWAALGFETRSTVTRRRP